MVRTSTLILDFTRIKTPAIFVFDFVLTHLLDRYCFIPKKRVDVRTMRWLEKMNSRNIFRPIGGAQSKILHRLRLILSGYKILRKKTIFFFHEISFKKIPT